MFNNKKGLGVIVGPCTGLDYADKPVPYGSAFGRIGIASLTIIGSSLMMKQKLKYFLNFIHGN